MGAVFVTVVLRSERYPENGGPRRQTVCRRGRKKMARIIKNLLRAVRLSWA